MCAKRKLHNNSYAFVKDGKSKSKFHTRWTGMIKRCYQESCKDYKNYGAKGVYICDEWLNRDNGFKNFEKWCLENNFKEGLTIDRIDVNGIYEPNNCRFITPEEQNKNQRPKSNIGVDYIFDIRKYNYKTTSNFRVFIGNGKSKYTKTIELALEIRKNTYGY